VNYIWEDYLFIQSGLIHRTSLAKKKSLKIPKG